MSVLIFILCPFLYLVDKKKYTLICVNGGSRVAHSGAWPEMGGAGWRTSPEKLENELSATKRDVVGLYTKLRRWGS
jgi:hypothetical protein